MNKKINARQTGLIIFLCIMANKILLLPSLMYQEARADSIFVLIILFLFELGLIPIFINMKRSYPDEKLLNILSKKMTPFVGKVIYLVLLVYFFFKIILTFSIVYVYLKQQVYQDEFLFLAIISIFPVINYATIKGLRPLTRTIELFFGVIVVGFLVCLSFSLFTDFSLPVFFVSTVKDLAGSFYKNIFSFGDFLMLFLLIDRIGLKKGDGKVLFRYAFFAIFLVLALFFIFFSKYQITAFMHNNAISDVLVLSIQFNAVGRLDIIAMLTVMIITLFQLAIFNYAFCDCLVNIFPLMKMPYAVAVFDILFFVLYYFFIGEYEIVIANFSNWQPILGMIVNYVFPVIFLILALIEKEKT